MATGNPFAIEALGGQGANIGRGLAGLGQVLEGRRQEKDAQARLIEGQEIFATNDPEQIARFSIANPEIGQRMIALNNHKNESTKANLVDSLKRIVINGEDPMNVLGERAQALEMEGADMTETMEAVNDSTEDIRQNALNMLALYDPVSSEAFRKSQMGSDGVDVGTEEGFFNRLASKLTPTERAIAERVKLGLSPRATGSAAQTIAAEGSTEDVAISESAIEGAKAGAKESAKLAVQFKLQPKVKLAVADAIAISTAKADVASTNRSNDKALDLYEAAMRSVAAAMDEAYTGPIAGLIPAMTANAQIADGAVAAMAPVLKQLFRASGEGIFTDKDQELLMKMAPTRKDLPEARAAKIENIDMIVRTKLAAAEAPTSTFQTMPEDNDALTWARSNPNDPRAAEIIRMQGAE